MYIRVEKVAHRFHPLLGKPLEGVDSTIGAADMEKDLHHLTN